MCEPVTSMAKLAADTTMKSKMELFIMEVQVRPNKTTSICFQ